MFSALWKMNIALQYTCKEHTAHPTSGKAPCLVCSTPKPMCHLIEPIASCSKFLEPTPFNAALKCTFQIALECGMVSEQDEKRVL